MHWLYRKSCIYVIKWRYFYSQWLHKNGKNDLSLYKDINIKDTGSVGFFKLV